MHDLAPFAPLFARFVLATGRATVPPTAWMPGYDAGSLARLEAYVARLSRDQARGVIAALQALRVRIGALRVGDGDAAVAAVGAALDRLDGGNPVDQLLLNTAILPLKVTHYAGEDVYRAMNVPFPAPTHTTEGPSARGIVDEAGLRDLAELELDAIIVGSGAGGAVVAAELAAAGLAVLVIEEGAWFSRRDFAGSAVERTARMYRNSGLTFTIGNPPIFLPIGRTVGGTTTINSGTCYRTPDRVLDRWVSDGLSGLTPAAMVPHFDAIEAVLGVAVAQQPWIGETGRIIARGCDALGYSHGPLRRNAPECDGQGECALGCPTDAKRSTNVSFIPLAIDRGASIAPETRLVGITRDGSRATGVVVEHLPSGSRHALRARAVVIAAGTLRTPLILEDAGVRHATLGRNLSIHPAAAVYAGFDRPVEATKSIPQGYAIDAFHDAGLLFEGGTVPPELAAGALPVRGAKLQELMAKFDHTVNFGFMVEDKGGGRVLGEVNDLPIVHYTLAERDLHRIQRGIEILVGVYLAAGARWVRPVLARDVVIRSFDDLRAFSGRPLTRSALQLTAYHPLGTARMAADPADGVVDERGRVHGVDGLYVADGAALPSSPAVNPQITIMALARRTAGLLAEHLAGRAA